MPTLPPRLVRFRPRKVDELRSRYRGESFVYESVSMVPTAPVTDGCQRWILSPEAAGLRERASRGENRRVPETCKSQSTDLRKPARFCGHGSSANARSLLARTLSPTVEVPVKKQLLPLPSHLFECSLRRRAFLKHLPSAPSAV